MPRLRETLVCLTKPQAEPTTNVLSHVLACMWRREIGGLFEVRCCVRSGASLLVLVTICRSVFAVVHRFRASQRAAALGHSQTAETVTATFPHARLSMARMSSQDLHARPETARNIRRSTVCRTHNQSLSLMRHYVVSYIKEEI